MINIPLAKLKCIKYQWFPLRDCAFKNCFKCEDLQRKYTVMNIIGMFVHFLFPVNEISII